MKAALITTGISLICFMVGHYFHALASTEPAGGNGSGGIAFIFYIFTALAWFVFGLAWLTGHV